MKAIVDAVRRQKPKPKKRTRQTINEKEEEIKTNINYMNNTFEMFIKVKLPHTREKKDGLNWRAS